MSLRYITHFVNIAGTITYTFPLAGMSQQVEQGWRTPMSTGVGANYAYDHLGYGVSPKDPRRIAIRALIADAPALTSTQVQTIMDEAQSECHRIGLGYLYRVDVDGSTYRRCLARLTSAPSITFDNSFNFGVSPMVLNFVAVSDWFATSATTGSQTITADPTLVTITNAGNIPVLSGITMSLTAITAAGFTNPSIYNATTLQRISTTRDSARIGDIWRIGDPDYKVGYGLPAMVVGKTGRYVGYAAVGPQNYQNDYALATLVNGFMRLEPGANSIYVFGATNATFDYSFAGAFA